MRDIPKRIIIRLSRIALKQISLFYILHLSICCMISLFFLEKQSEIRNSFTFFEKWKVKKIILSLFLRNEKWNDFFFHSFREMKVKWKWLEIEIEKWKWNKNDSRSRSRSEISKKISRILENRDSRRALDLIQSQRRVIVGREKMIDWHSVLFYSVH